ncbi:hypothetical protein PGT21_029017 [Puccinia graminis f. sp. tritici]|uniref:Uncharacterized protein n=1 Tax=Puccinia graminis f. sp. tritici TaxID=56615 RepID=A0A5B0PLS6_PUCGR|nr:hypothetical protein PGT21_029017 [Puccinia graminis f. sp. tritici]
MTAWSGLVDVSAVQPIFWVSTYGETAVDPGQTVEDDKPNLQGPEDGQDVHEESGFDIENCTGGCNDLDNKCPNNLYEHVDDLSEQEQASETASDNCDPEVLTEVVPEYDDPQVPEPAFSMDNYSAKDVDCWARTLSADQFEHLCIMGPDARIKSFQQYAIYNLDRPSRTFAQHNSLSHVQPNQPPLAGTNQQDDTPSQQPDEINNHIYYQHHPNYQTDSYNNISHSGPPLATTTHIDHLAILNTSGGDFNVGSNRLDKFNDSGCFDSFNDSGGFDDHSYFEDSGGSLDDGGFDDGGFDNGGFRDGGFDNGGFDNGGFDNGGFDNGGFDNGSFDERFDDGGFDDGYGSAYY